MPILEEQSSDMSWIWQVNREQRDGDDWQSSFLQCADIRRESSSGCGELANFGFFAALRCLPRSAASCGDKRGTLKSAKSTNKGRLWSCSMPHPLQRSLLLSKRVGISDSGTTLYVGHGRAKTVLHGPNSTETNLFHHGETTYRVGWMS